MKNLIFYSSDFSMCLSLIMYLQNSYNITTTTDLEVLREIVKTPGFDLLILDTEPSKKIEAFCENIRKDGLDIPIVFTYVYQSQIKDFETNIRKYANSIFYKPFDLNEVTKHLSELTV